MEEESAYNGGCLWDDLPVEIGDLILHFAVSPSPGEDEDLGLLMEVVICFVCRTWNKRKDNWIKKKSVSIFARERFLSGVLTELAASLGRVSLLKWLISKFCPIRQQAAQAASKAGHLEVLQWLRKNGCPWSWLTFDFAAKGRHHEVAKWAKENGCPTRPY